MPVILSIPRGDDGLKVMSLSSAFGVAEVTGLMEVTCSCWREWLGSKQSRGMSEGWQRRARRPREII